MKNNPDKQITENKEFAKLIIQHYFGSKPHKVEYMPAGETNFVFETHIDKDKYIIRISKSAAKITDFHKEQWILARVREKGIPVGEILEVGNDVIPSPYMVQKKIEGTEALFHPEKTRILYKMGELTSRINSIETKGFGKEFDWSENMLSKNNTWKEFLNNELEISQRLQIMEKHHMMSKANSRKLKTTLLKLGDRHPSTVLNHGDMRRKNVIVNDKGDILAIIDWEESCSSIAPYWDLSIALHDLAVDDKQTFLEGYGISPKEYAKIVQIITALNIINYAPVIESLAKKKDKHTLDFYRLRLSGHLDMYSL